MATKESAIKQINDTIKTTDGTDLITGQELNGVLKEIVGAIPDNAVTETDLTEKLGGGSTGQVLKKKSNASMDFGWAAEEGGGGGTTGDVEIYNGLDRETAGAALDARQGKVLNDRFNDFNDIKQTLEEDAPKGQVLTKIANTPGYAWEALPTVAEQVVALPDWRGFTAATTSEELAKVGDLIITTGKSYVTVCVDTPSGGTITTVERDNGCAPTEIRIVENRFGTEELYLSMSYNGKSYSCKISKLEGPIGRPATYSTEGTETHTSADGVELITKEI